MENNPVPCEWTIPGPVLLLILTILAANTIFDPGLSTNGRSWDKASPFTCLYQSIYRLFEICQALVGENENLSFSFNSNEATPIRCLNIAALTSLAILLGLIGNALWVKFFASIYMANWILTHIVADPEFRSDEFAAGKRQRIDGIFAVLVHSIAYFTTVSSFGTVLDWTSFGNLYWAIAIWWLGPLPQPSSTLHMISTFGLLVSHWVFLALATFMAHGPLSAMIGSSTGQDWDASFNMKNRPSVQVGAVLVYDIALATYLCCPREPKRAPRWSDFLFALIVLVTGVLHFGQTRDMYPVFGHPPTASISLAYWC